MKKFLATTMTAALVAMIPMSAFATSASLHSYSDGENYSTISSRHIKAEASSTLDGYPVSNLLDGKKTTTWSEGVRGYGEGSELTFHFAKKYNIIGFRIRAGYHKSDKVYNNNGRPDHIEITTASGESLGTVNLQDSQHTQTVLFSKSVKTDELSIIIKDVTAGNKYEDTCISEITFLVGTASDTSSETSLNQVGKVTSNGGTVNLRKDASSSSAKVTSLKNGTRVTIVGAKNNFYKLTTSDGKATGYMSKNYLTIGYPAQTTAKVNFRKSENGAIIRSLTKGTKLTVLSIGSKWSKVKVGDKEGYIYNQYYAF